MPPPDDRAVRAARQVLRTDQLLGLDFVALPAPRGEPAAPAPPGPPVPDVVVAPDDAAPGLIVIEPELPPADKQAALEALHRRHDETCPHCTRATYHARTVFGEGAPDADLVFVGEAPGEQEDRTGRPFVGRAGQKLDEMIRSMGLRREDAYIANVLKSRPPNNRTPLRDEVEGCSPFLVEQLDIIRPKVIMTLGGPATKLILKTETGITRLRGQWASFRVGGREVPVMPTFHPAYLLRNYTRDTREKVWSDLQAVMARLGARGAADADADS